MKRHTQTVGVRRWAGDDLVELQSEPMKVLDAFFAEHGPCIIEGCAVAAAGDNSYNVAAGLVALEAEDADGVRRVMAMPFAGVSGTPLPVYLVPEAETVTDVYDDGKVHPIAYDYRATATAVKPSEGSFLTIGTKGGVRFTDAVQDGTHRFITDAERTDWNKKETPDGAQEKADAALTAAKKYADTTEDNAVRDAVLGTRWTGAMLNNGWFVTRNETLLFSGARTIRVVFVTGADVDTGQTVFRDGYNKNHNSVTITKNIVSGWLGGVSYYSNVRPHTLYEVILVRIGDGTGRVIINGEIQSKTLSEDAEEARFVEVGNSENQSFTGCIVSVDIFDFPFSDEHATASWNDGHPELWSVPDKYRNGAEGSRCMLDLSPASLTPTVWYDLSGQGNDVPYVPAEGQPAEATLVTDTTAIASLADVEREALLAYARRYDADRAAVLLRQADLTATAELEEHTGDAVAHITSAERSAWNAKETPDDAQEKADAAEETAVRDAVLGTRITGVEAGNGKFYYAQTDVTFEGERTVRVVFRTGEDIQAPQCICVDGTSNVTSQITVTNGSIVVRAAGSSYTFKGVKPNTIYEAVAVTKAEGGRVYLNGEGQNVAENTHSKPSLFLIGSNHNDGYVFTGTVLTSQLFNFAFSDEDAAASWNGGHPELWHVPDVLRYKSPTVWPTATYKSGSTFIRNGDSIVETDNIPSANGFSKDYQRFEQNPTAYCAFLNESRLNTKPFRWKFTIEYRADSSVTVEMKGGYPRPAFTLDANTGDAKTVQFVTDAGYGVALRTRGGGTYLEVATISVESANIVCNLIPASLTPTVWYDLSGRHNDVPYVPFEGKPAEAALSCCTEGFAATTDADREALLAYACQYDADREVVLLRRANLTATAELEEHVDDKKCHLTNLERQNWDSAIQSAKIGDKDVPKSGTTLQFPAYPHVPQMDRMQGTAPDIPCTNSTIYHAVFGNMLFVTGAFTGTGQAGVTGMSIPIPGFDRMIMGWGFKGAIVVDSGTRDAENIYTTTITTTTVNGNFGLSINWGVGLMLNGVDVILMPILIPLASQPWDV